MVSFSGLSDINRKKFELMIEFLAGIMQRMLQIL